RWLMTLKVRLLDFWAGLSRQGGDPQDQGIQGPRRAPPPRCCVRRHKDEQAARAARPEQLDGLPLPVPKASALHEHAEADRADLLATHSAINEGIMASSPRRKVTFTGPDGIGRPLNPTI